MAGSLIARETRYLVVRYLFVERVSTCREFRIFIVNKSVTADGSLLSPTGCVNGIHPAPDIHEHFMIYKGYGTLRISSRGLRVDAAASDSATAPSVKN